MSLIKKVKIGLSSEDKQKMKNEVIEEVNKNYDNFEEEVKETLSGLGQLKPSGTSLEANILSFTENKGIWVATDTGHWYYFDELTNSYTDGGVYQAVKIADGSVTPEKTSFIENNIVYKNDLIEVTANNQTWKSYNIDITDFEIGETYTIKIDEIIGGNSDTKCVFKVVNSENSNLVYHRCTDNYLNYTFVIPTGSVKMVITFYASQDTAYTGTAIFKNVKLIKGTEITYKLNENIKLNIEKITPEKTSFIENNIVYKNDLISVLGNTNENNPYTATRVDITDIVDGELYTLSIDKIEGYNTNMTCIVVITITDINDNQLYYFNIPINDDNSLKHSFLMPINSYNVRLTLYSKYDGVNSEIVNFYNIRFIKGYNSYILASDIAILNNNIAKDYGLPVIYLNGSMAGINKEDKVTLNYNYKELAGTCTLKWQGSSSLAYPKKNYTITFDNDFEVVEGWGEQKKYCLKANYIDFSHSRNIVCAKLWGDIVKSRTNSISNLNNLINGGAVDGIPVGLVINGKYQGLYTLNIPKDKWMLGMGNGSNECIVSAEEHSAMTNFKEPVVIDGTYFEYEYITDEDNTSWAQTSLNNIYNALQNVNANNIDTTLGKYLDLESAIDYFIFVCLIDGNDMTGRNYLISTYDGVKWFYTAYDMDTTFGNHWKGNSYSKTLGGITPNSFIGSNAVMNALVKYKKEAVKNRYAELRNTILKEDYVIEKFLNYEVKIPKAIFDEEVKIWRELPGTSTNSISQIAIYILQRFSYIDSLIEAL